MASGNFDWRWNYPENLWSGMGVPPSYQPQQGQGTSNMSQQLQNYYNSSGMTPSTVGGGSSTIQMPSTGTFGQTGGQWSPQAFQNLYIPSFLKGQDMASQLELMGQRRSQGEQILSKYNLDKPETYFTLPNQMAELQNEMISKDWENASRGVENEYARSGASLSSERDRAMQETRGATTMAMRQSKTQAELQGRKDYQSMIANLLKLLG